MPRYIVQRDYWSHAARWKAGLVVELGAEEAAWFNRDSLGVLKLIEERPPEPVAERAVEQPPQDRMVRKPSKRRA
jgi:hypothetical protein